MNEKERALREALEPFAALDNEGLDRSLASGMATAGGTITWAMLDTARDALLAAPAPSEPEGEAERLAANDELLYVRGKRDGKTVPVLYKRIPADAPAPSEPCVSCAEPTYDEDTHDHHYHGDRGDPYIGPAHPAPSTDRV